MHAGTGRKVLLVAFLFSALLIVPTALAQEELRRDSTMRGDPTTPTGEVIGPIYEQIIWLSIAIFVLVAIVLVYILIRFRQRRGTKTEVPQIHGNSRLEIAWTIGPALVMVYLLVISYNGLLAIDMPEAEPEVIVDVTASRFNWEFIYPDGETAGRSQYTLSGGAGTFTTLRVQEDTWVQLRVTSTDVIHAIAVPGLDVMIDANPGRTNLVMFNAQEPGVYLVQCRQFCGTGHGEMLGALEVFAAGTQELPYGAAPRPSPPVETPPPQGNETGNETEEPGVEVDRTIEVRAFDFGFDPEPLRDIEPGETVEIVMINDGPSPHNLFIGSFDRSSDKGEAVCTDPNDQDTCWATEFTIAPGNRDSFVFTAPEEPEAFDVWCDISGHASLGMLTYLSVGGAEPEIEEGPQPRLPGPGIALSLIAFLGAVVLLARRR